VLLRPANHLVGWAGQTVTASSPIQASAPDLLITALARYVEALHERYPDGPDQMRKENLDARANMRRMRKSGNGRAA
jgi:hypothetical protein